MNRSLLACTGFLILIVLGFAQNAFAQNDNVGIGTTVPHENAILDISSVEKGLLLPRLNTLQRLAVNPTAGSDGLMVYDTDLDEFCYWDENDAQWVCIAQGGGQGPTGPTGPAGADGQPGPQGPQGPAGPAGADGPTGPTGPAGVNGATGPIGPIGPAGPAGATGATGPQGPTGPTGPAGADGADGATGPQGPAGPAGPVGATGPQGPQGAQGVTGPAGSSDFASVALSSTATVSSATYANVGGMTLNFTATGTQAFISFTASGYGYTNSMSFVSFRVMQNSTAVAKTNTKIQSYDDVTGTITPWSCATSRLLTGLVAGNNYTLTVQGLVGGIDGVYDAIVNPGLDGHHMTLTVIQ